MASLLGADDEIPNLAIGASSYNLGHPLWASGFKAQMSATFMQRSLRELYH